MSELISARLRRRNRTEGSGPLITYYDLDSGERTELSGITFGNWVDKTANLLVDELLVDAGDRVELAVAGSHPGHWVTLVWELACWQIGATVTLSQPSSARLVVAGPDWQPYLGAADLVACSLHPLGLGFPQPLPSGVIDYSLEVRGQPDSFAAAPQSGLALSWLDGERQLSQADLVGVEVGVGERERGLVQPTDPWSTAHTALLQPILTGGSAVVVAGRATPEHLARIATSERTTPAP